MTVDPLPFKRSKRPLTAERVQTVRVMHGKKHFNMANSSVKNEIKKVVKKEWRPSENLLKFNEKEAACYTGSMNMKKKIKGCYKNASSTLGEATNSSEFRRVSSKAQLDNSCIKNIISYKDGPKYREVKISDNICKVNPYTRNKELVKSFKSLSDSYNQNRLYGCTSKIPFA